MRTIIVTLTGLVLASCTAVPPSPQEAMRQQEALATQLAGRAAGPPVSCLPAARANRQTNLSDQTILFDYGSTVYRNDPPGGCPGLGTGGSALVTRNTGSALCRGDIAQVIDTQSGMIRGSCSLGDFVPYRRMGA